MVMKKNTFELDMTDREVLYQAYIPSIRNGALFVHTEQNYWLGDEVTLMLTLADEPEVIPVAGNVVWITPTGAHGNRPAGIGIRFHSSDKGMTRKKIETHLATLLKADKPTLTM
jgi:type IV pilus assembly protein PilZ